MSRGLVLVAGFAAVVGCPDGKTTEPPHPDWDFLSLAPAALTIAQGANGNTAVTLTRINFTGAVTLSLGGAPAGVTRVV
jgi:hypothetical protein